SILIEDTIKHHGCFFILDVHSYNHRRESPFKCADPATHPDINLGTAYNKKKWQELCDRYRAFLAGAAVFSDLPDVRQNVVFKGGAFAQWVIENFGEYGAVLSVEFKKTFMDEWTGIADIPHVQQLKKLLQLSVNFFT